jgi:hypothetical protein
MNNDCEIRAALLELCGAYAETLRAAASLAKTLPAEYVADARFLCLAEALDALQAPLRALAGTIEPPNVRAELYQTLAAAIAGRGPGERGGR